MRSFGRLVGVAVILVPGLIGCGGSGIQEGVPKNVDFSKPHTPAAGVGFMPQPGMQKQAAEQAKKNAAASQPK